MQYVNPKAKQPVNLDGTVVEYIIKQLDFPKTDTFYEAQRQVRMCTMHKLFVAMATSLSSSI